MADSLSSFLRVSFKGVGGKGSRQKTEHGKRLAGRQDIMRCALQEAETKPRNSLGKLPRRENREGAVRGLENLQSSMQV